MPDMVLPLTTRSLADAVHTALRTWILTEGAGSEELVTEAGVATRFGVARPTARVAVERLVADGLLVRDGRRGARIPALEPADVEDLYAGRILVEGEAHARLARAGNVPVSAVVANARLRFHTEHPDPAGSVGDVVAADVEFHRELVRAVGSHRLDRMHGLLMGEAHLCMARVQTLHLLAGGTIADEHDGLLEAIGHGDVRAVDTLTRTHLVSARDKLLTMLPVRAPRAG